MDPSSSLTPSHITSVRGQADAAGPRTFVQALDAQYLQPQGDVTPELRGPLMVAKRNGRMLQSEIQRIGTRLTAASLAGDVSRVIEWMAGGRHIGALVEWDVAFALKSLDQHVGELLQIVPPHGRDELLGCMTHAQSLATLLATLSPAARPTLRWLERTGAAPALTLSGMPGKDLDRIIKDDFGEAESCLRLLTGLDNSQAISQVRTAFLQALDDRFMAVLQAHPDAHSLATQRMESLEPALQSVVRTLARDQVPYLLCLGLQHAHSPEECETYLKVATRVPGLQTADGVHLVLSLLAAAPLSSEAKQLLLRRIKAEVHRLPQPVNDALKPAWLPMEHIVRSGEHGETALARLPSIGPGMTASTSAYAPIQQAAAGIHDRAIRSEVDTRIQRGLDLDSTYQLLKWIHARVAGLGPEVLRHELLRIDAAFGERLQLAGPAARATARQMADLWATTVSHIQRGLEPSRRPGLAWLVEPPLAELVDVRGSEPNYVALAETSLHRDFGMAETHLRCLADRGDQLDAEVKLAVLHCVDDRFMDLLATRPIDKDLRVAVRARSASLNALVESVQCTLSSEHRIPMVCVGVKMNTPHKYLDLVARVAQLAGAEQAVSLLTDMRAANLLELLQAPLVFRIARKISGFPREQALASTTALNAAWTALPKAYRPDITFLQPVITAPPELNPA